MSAFFLEGVGQTAVFHSVSKRNSAVCLDDAVLQEKLCFRINRWCWCWCIAAAISTKTALRSKKVTIKICKTCVVRRGLWRSRDESGQERAAPASLKIYLAPADKFWQGR